MPTHTLKSFSKELEKLERGLGRRAAAAMRETARRSVAIVRTELRNAVTKEGAYPLIASKKMYSSTRWDRVSGANRGRRAVASVGVYTKYAAAMEYGTGPFTPPMAPLIQWATYKIAASKRKKTAGKSKGSKIRAASGGQSKGGAKQAKSGAAKAGSAEARRMAYFVQQKIANKGIRPRLYMGKSMDKIGKRAMVDLRKEGKKLKAKYPVKITVRALV